MARHRTPEEQAFHTRYIVNPVTGCWMWTGSRDKNGYGEWQTEKTPLGNGKYRRVRKKAHRISWEIHRGPIPAGMEVCHDCDNPPCVNPDHLFCDAHAENMIDRDRKGRQARGERQGAAKITEEDAIDIRNSNETLVILAARYGLSQQNVSDIRTGKLWSHVTGGKNANSRANQGRKGEANNMARLTEADIPVIRARRAAGEKIAVIAKDYGIADTMVSLIYYRKAWGHIP
jgi:HNH endonuclease